MKSEEDKKGKESKEEKGAGEVVGERKEEERKFEGWKKNDVDKEREEEANEKKRRNEGGRIYEVLRWKKSWKKESWT